MIGGWADYDYLDNFAVFSLNNSSDPKWELKPKRHLIQQLAYFGYIIYKNDIIITFGGNTKGATPIDSIYYIDISSDNSTWKESKIKCLKKGPCNAILTNSNIIHIIPYGVLGGYKDHFSIQISEILPAKLINKYKNNKLLNDNDDIKCSSCDLFKERINILTKTLNDCQKHADKLHKLVKSLQKLNDNDIIIDKLLQEINEYKDANDMSHSNVKTKANECQYSKTKIKILNWPNFMTEDTLVAIFAPCGNIVNVNIVKNDNNINSFVAYVEYLEPKSAKTAINTLNGWKIHTTKLFVSYAKNIKTLKAANNDNTKLINNNWPSTVGDALLSALFSPYGTMKSHKIVNQCGIVEYDTNEEAKKALNAINGCQIDSNKLIITFDNNLKNISNICGNDNSKINGNYSVYVALDFGTDGTGLAYSLPNDNKVYIHDKWKTWNKNKSKYNISNIKPKTAILLHKNGKFKAFGDNALQVYMNMKDTQSLLFEHFKMNLYNDGNIIKDKLKAMNGKLYPTSKVFIEALKYLKKQTTHILRRIRNNLNKNIFWIITIPAIWNDSAKQKMREWSIKAGIIDRNTTHNLLLAYEADCASLSVRNEILNNVNINNTKYILIDAGCGTVDIVCHKILNNKFNVIKELLPPSGGAWGDMYVDNYFINILYKIFNIKWINKFKKEEPNSYLTLLDNFRISKSTFNNSKQWHNVNIPFEFVGFMEEQLEEDDDNNDQDLEDLINNFKLNKWNNCFNLDGESLKIHNNIWKYELFDKVINPIIIHCKNLLSHKTMNGCNILCIVGGFGSNTYFQNKIKSEFGINTKYKLNIIIPKRPILSVLDGAARMWKTHNFVNKH